jgi:hypothetical protein
MTLFEIDLLSIPLSLFLLGLIPLLIHIDVKGQGDERGENPDFFC